MQSISSQIRSASPWLYAAIFALSGFSGLVYESVWTRYLKLFLGAAAFAQALTLALFMGGMAAGAWLASRYGKRSKNPLFWYAVAEGAIGVMGLGFHPFFVWVTDFAYQTLFPALGYSPWAAGLAKWILAGGMILPQSILLGATFPLMTAGVIRKHPQTPGETISFLYFVNSLGGALGVLISGFYLLEKYGLPGAIATAGWINIGVMAAVLALSGMDRAAKTSPAPQDAAGKGAGWLTPRLLVCAGLTGAASFFYEIGWIRMLTLVLGASSHSFELMLSAFILGLAIGGLIIRFWIGRLENHLATLAEIQVAMGALALATIYVYAQSFDVTATLLKALAKTSEGYALFHVSSHLIAMAVMLPATVMAGMTLPLITHFLFIKGEGEASIGQVYAANTLGSILGVIFAAHIVMPVFGLKAVIIAGAALDIAVGMWLVILSGQQKGEKTLAAVAVFGLAAVLATSLFAKIDPLKMASGVFRFGKFLAKDTVVAFHKDGATATVDVLLGQGFNPRQTISTNGKPDAAIGFDSPSIDETTMVLAAALPLDINPGAKEVAVVGIGCGLTTHTAASFPGVKQVDTVEIEPAMVEGAKLFGPTVEKAFKEPKSRIHINDAKAYFASTGKKYDLIISEPSNPWVAGVAGLFSTEFYQMVGRSLNDGGMLVQWIQLYEMEPELVASVMKALSANFQDYAVYLATDTDMLTVARKGAAVGAPTGEVFGIPDVRKSLNRLGIESTADLALRRIGGKKALDPLFASYQIGMNSDYHPVLEEGAIRARFMLSKASSFPQLRSFPIPVVEVLEGTGTPGGTVGPNQFLTLAQQRRRAMDILRALDGDAEASLKLDVDAVGYIRQIRSIQSSCPSGAEASAWLEDVNRIAFMIQPFGPREELEKLWGGLATTKCFSSLPDTAKNWISLHRAVAARDFPAAMTLAGPLAQGKYAPNSGGYNYLTAAAMLSRIVAGKEKAAGEIWKMYKQTPDTPLPLRLLGAMTQTGDKADSPPAP